MLKFINHFVFFSEDIYLSFGISIDFSSVCETVSGLLRDTVLVILPVILLLIKSPVVSAAFGIALFVAVSGASVADCLA